MFDKFFGVVRTLATTWALYLLLLPATASGQATEGMEIFKNFGPTLSALSPPVPPTTLFPTTIKCMNGSTTVYQTTTNLSTQGQYGNNFVSVNNLPVGSTCTITEDSAQFPPLPVGCTWNTPQITPSPSITILHGQHFPQVLNEVTCSPVSGNIAVEKTMSTTTDMQPPSGTTFAVNASCTNSQQVFNGQVSLGTSSLSVMAANGSTCTVSEDTTQLPTLPNGCTWDTPTYPNGNQANIGGPPVQIINSISCPPAPTTVPIVKSMTSVSLPSVPPGVVFNFTANCSNPTQSYTASIPFNSPTGSAFTNIPVGSVCTITEDASALPSLLNGCTWLPPSYPSTAPVTASSPPGNPFVIINGMTCPPPPVLSSVSITKQIDLQSLQSFIPGGTFDFTVQCTNPSQTYTGSVVVSASGSATTTIPNIPAGSVCDVLENINTLPPVPNDCEWDTAIYQNQNTGITVTQNGAGPVLVTNSISCLDGAIDIGKFISADSDYTPPAGSVFNFDISCTGGQNLTASVTSQGGSSALLGSTQVSGITTPADCTITEVTGSLPALPAHCAWDTPTYPPNNPVSVSPGGTATFQVTNSVTCQTGGLEITKKYDGDIPAAAGLGSGTVVPVTAECPPGSGNIINGTMTMPGGGAISGLPVGPCQISEDITQLPALQNGCMWNPPQYYPATQLVNVGTTGTTPSSVVISNGVSCPPEPTPDSGTISVEKVWGDLPKGFIPSPSFTFPVTLQCVLPGSPGLVLPPIQSTLTMSGVFVNNIPLGAICTVTEASPMPPLPAGCSWLPPSYPNGNTVTVNDVIAGASQTVEIKNGVVCKRKPPFVEGDVDHVKDPKIGTDDGKAPPRRRSLEKRGDK